MPFTWEKSSPAQQSHEMISRLEIRRILPYLLGFASQASPQRQSAQVSFGSSGPGYEDFWLDMAKSKKTFLQRQPVQAKQKKPKVILSASPMEYIQPIELAFLAELFSLCDAYAWDPKIHISKQKPIKNIEKFLAHLTKFEGAKNIETLLGNQQGIKTKDFIIIGPLEYSKILVDLMSHFDLYLSAEDKQHIHHFVNLKSFFNERPTGSCGLDANLLCCII